MMIIFLISKREPTTKFYATMGFKPQTGKQNLLDNLSKCPKRMMIFFGCFERMLLPLFSVWEERSSGSIPAASTDEREKKTPLPVEFNA